MLRTYFFYLVLGLYLLFSLFNYLVYLILGLFSKDLQYRFVHTSVASWGRLMVALSSSKITVIGKEKLPEGNVLYVSNHQGNYDIPVLLGFLPKPKAFLAKIELEKVPIISLWMRTMGCLFLDRGNLKQSLRVILKGIEQLKSGHTLIIFPEGTRSKGTPLLDFKKGSLKLGLKAGIPIVPITLDGTYTMYEETGYITKSKATITIHDPIYPSTLSKEEQNTLIDTVKATIASALPL